MSYEKIYLEMATVIKDFEIKELDDRGQVLVKLLKYNLLDYINNCQKQYYSTLNKLNKELSHD